jgi:ribosomal protein L11 methyltransferase
MMHKPARKWLKVTISCESAAFEAVANFLFELGAAGVEEHETSVTAYFDASIGISELKNSLNVFIGSLTQMELNVGKPEYREQRNEDWSSGWRDYFHAISVTENIVVKPPWEAWKGNQPIVIDIMPRMAFGTGSHESTQLCLGFLDAIIQITGMTVLDVGTGSGILAIAAAKMGAAVLAVDIDENAFDNAQENNRLNHTRVDIIKGSLESVPSRQYDLIVANINRDVLIRMFPELTRFSHATTRMIFSGLLIRDVDDFNRAVRDQAWNVIEKKVLGDWAGLVVGRPVVNSNI